MYRFLILVLAVSLAALLGISCAKPKTTNPVPVAEFIDFRNAGKSSFTQGDTAVIVLGYEDGDGDLFVDNNSENYNVVFTTYAFNAAENKFVAELTNSLPRDTARYVSKIRQPEDGYYKGKSIRGEIHIPLNEFRQHPNTKIIKFTGFLMDQKEHKSNIFVSPVYTLNF